MDVKELLSASLKDMKPEEELQKLVTELAAERNRIKLQRAMLVAARAVLNRDPDERACATTALQLLDMSDSNIEEALNDINWEDPFQRLFAMINFLGEGRAIALHHLYKGYVIHVIEKAMCRAMTLNLMKLKEEGKGIDEALDTVDQLSKSSNMHECVADNIERFELKPGCEAFFEGIISMLETILEGDTEAVEKAKEQLVSGAEATVRAVADEVERKLDEVLGQLEMHEMLVNGLAPFIKAAGTPEPETETEVELGDVEPIDEIEARQRILDAVEGMPAPERARVIKSPETCTLEDVHGDMTNLLAVVMARGLNVEEIAYGLAHGFVEIPEADPVE